MAPSLQIVNGAPGKSQELLLPGKPWHFGAKSLTSAILPDSINVSMGMSRFIHHGMTPEADESLTPAEVYLSPVENFEPAGLPINRTIVGNALKLSKSNSDDFERGVYSIRYPIAASSSIAGYVRYRKANWWTRKPDWCFLDDMVGMVFGLRHGPNNVTCNVYLQDQAEGRLVVAGPLSYLNAPRPGPAPTPFAWKGTPNGTAIELWVFFNDAGYPAPFNPPLSPTVEVWARCGDAQVVVGPFPVTVYFTDPHAVADSFATLYFGNSGMAGDEMVIEEWGLYPDYRISVRDADPTPYHSFSLLPDSPVVYRTSSGVLPNANRPCRWFPVGTVQSPPPDLGFSYQAGQQSVPFAIPLKKTTAFGQSVLEREEPVLSNREEGFLLESFISGKVETTDGDCFGGGLCVDDGQFQYKAVMLRSSTRRTIGLAVLAGPYGVLDSYLLPEQDIDYSSHKTLQLGMDRLAGVLFLRVDGEVVLEVPLTDPSLAPPASTSAGRVRVGHVVDSAASGSVSVSSILSLNRYVAFEGSRNVDPRGSPLNFLDTCTGPQNSGELVGGQFVFSKKTAAPGSQASLFRMGDFAEYKGSFLEFEASLETFSDSNGTSYASNVDTGVGATLHFGNKRLRIGFFDCGVYGRMLGVVPGSGSVEDITSQSLLGRRFSARCDWHEKVSVRALVRAFDRIEVWIGSVANDPAIVIPWRNNTEGFDLPDDNSVPGISFGHYVAAQTGKSAWGALRWGSSNGYEAIVAQGYNGETPSFVYGGRMMRRIDFRDES